MTHSHDTATPALSVESEALTFTYTNWRGETALRRVRAKGACFRFGATEWHPEPQWLLSAIDLEKMEGRDFAVRDIVFATPAPSPSPAAKGGDAGEAVEPVAWRRRGKHRWFYREHAPTSQSESGWLPLYAHPAPEDTARLREELERATRELEEETALRVGAIDRMKVAERERDDARKALETATATAQRLYDENCRENGVYDPSTNATEFSGAAEDMDILLQQILEDLQAPSDALATEASR